MKATHTIIALVIALASTGTAYYFLNNHSDTNDAFLKLFVDITDKDSAQVQAHEVMTLATNNFTSKEDITIQTEALSNYHINPVQEFHLPKENFITGNSQRRRRTISKLSKQLDTAIQNMYAEQSAKKQSKIFLPFLHAVNELSETKAKNKIIICASDLVENNKTFTCFDPISMKLLKKDPDLIEMVLLQGNTVKNLRGMTIYLVHHPRNERDDELFNVMAHFYKRFYEAYGAKVYIQDNLLTH